jgi:hypothetical protein
MAEREPDVGDRVATKERVHVRPRLADAVMVIGQIAAKAERVARQIVCALRFFEGISECDAAGPSRPATRRIVSRAYAMA